MRNQGLSAAPATTTQYYLSTTPQKTGASIGIGSRSAGALMAGASSPGTATVTVPRSTSQGTYFLLACADDPGQVTETDETNNCRAAAATIVITK